MILPSCVPGRSGPCSLALLLVSPWKHDDPPLPTGSGPNQPGAQMSIMQTMLDWQKRVMEKLGLGGKDSG
jgi:hypothetical protein